MEKPDFEEFKKETLKDIEGISEIYYEAKSFITHARNVEEILGAVHIMKLKLEELENAE